MNFFYLQIRAVTTDFMNIKVCHDVAKKSHIFVSPSTKSRWNFFIYDYNY